MSEANFFNMPIANDIIKDSIYNGFVNIDFEFEDKYRFSFFLELTIKKISENSFELIKLNDKLIIYSQNNEIIKLEKKNDTYDYTINDKHENLEIDMIQFINKLSYLKNNTYIDLFLKDESIIFKINSLPTNVTNFVKKYIFDMKFYYINTYFPRLSTKYRSFIHENGTNLANENAEYLKYNPRNSNFPKFINKYYPNLKSVELLILDEDTCTHKFIFEENPILLKDLDDKLIALCFMYTVSMYYTHVVFIENIDEYVDKDVIDDFIDHIKKINFNPNIIVIS